MLLAIDVSNSTIKAGVFNNVALIASWQIATERHKVVDDYAVLFLNLFRTKDIDPGVKLPFFRKGVRAPPKRRGDPRRLQANG